jgi:hypothetical protein
MLYYLVAEYSVSGSKEHSLRAHTEGQDSARQHASLCTSARCRGIKEVVTMKAWTRWQDWVSLVLGVLLFIAPWVFGTATNGARSWDAWIIGAIGVILALGALALPRTASIAEGLSVILGVLLFISPWVLGFAALSSAAWTAWIIGVLFVLVNGWTLLQTRSPRVGAPAA